MSKKHKKRASRTASDNVEIYRQLRTNIEYSFFDRDIQVVSVTSANVMEGKSTVSSNLAKVFASKYNRVLLIDCDLRRPTQHKIFKISNKYGLSNLMKKTKGFDLNDEMYFQKRKDVGTEDGLYILTSGSSVPNPLELLSSVKFKELLDLFRKQFDFIIIDCPPLNAVADAIPVSNNADGAIFVVSAKETDKREAKNALTMLQRNGSHVLGSVLTKADNTRHSYYYYNYY